ncbi:MAG: hypothetical protein GY772_02510 [bacterium]|nr:hypothetical protein [bacterium]
MAHPFQYSLPTLPDDTGYVYRHVHVLDRAIRRRVASAALQDRLFSEDEWRDLGVTQRPGWEHVMWHRREPGILIFRRRASQTASPPVPEAEHSATAELAAAAPDDVAVTNSALDLPPPVEASPPAPLEASPPAPVEASPPAPVEASPPGPRAARSALPGRQRKRRLWQGAALPRPPEGADESLAMLGWGLVLFEHQVPGIACFIDEMRKCRDCFQSPRALAVAALLLRGVRGSGGMRCAGKVLRDTAVQRLLLHERDLTVVWEKLGLVLGVVLRLRIRKGGWTAEQRQGRHIMFSGKHFARALAQATGCASMAAAVEALEPVLACILDGRVLSDSAVQSLPRLVRGKMVVACLAQSLRRAGGYYAMDFGRHILLLARSWGTPVEALSDASFSAWLRAQRPASRRVVQTTWGIKTAAGLEAKRTALQRSATMLLPLRGRAAKADVTVGELFWPQLFYFACEFASMLRRCGRAQLDSVLCGDLKTVWATTEELKLWLRRGHPSRPAGVCWLTACVWHASLALKATKTPQRRLTGKQAQSERHGGGQPPRPESSGGGGGGQSPRPAPLRGGEKATVICIHCGRKVRRDVLARHHSTAICERVAAQRMALDCERR